ncbi:MAG: PEGA domain-containing protein [Deltaproteobacteria bacterium]|nr:PEGA domain-containing protein [Deltaproteobacteria bacterium]
MNHFSMSVSLAVALGIGAYLSSSADQPNKALAASPAGAISGRVVFTGDAPAAKKIKVTKDGEKCGAEVTSEELVVGPDKGVEFAVVSVAGFKGTPPKPTNPSTIDQKGCVFRPHVAIVGVGAPLDILNNDGILHNFHTHGTENTPMNRAQPAFRKKMTETFAQAETVKVSCDAHPWMSAWVVVTDHPYIDATDNGGNFKIADVPPGNHTVEVWHETLGKMTKTVTVKAGEEAKVTFELSKK